jgi:hypothetical protein
MKAHEIAPSPCDGELKSAIEAWRQQHRLREDDAVLLLVQLLKIHQDHWEALRKKDFPSFEPLRVDMGTLLEVNRSLYKQAHSLSVKLGKASRGKDVPTVTRTAGWLAALAGVLGGYLIGKVFQ